MFAYNPTVNDRSGEILGAGQMRAADTQAQMYNQLGNNIGGALASLGGAFGESMKENKNQKRTFEGMYNFLSSKNMLSPEIDATLQGFAQKKDFASANAYIAPYLAELDFGRRSMLAGRSGFFDGSGNWQMAMPAQAVEPRNKYNYTVGGGS
jgi:hypothetical protein